MEFLGQAFKILGYIAGILVFVSIIIGVIYTPIKNKIEEKKINEFADVLYNELIKAVKEQEDAKKQPKKRGRKPKKIEEK